MDSLQPGVPLIHQSRSDTFLDGKTQEIVFSGTGTMFEETLFSYDFEATGAGLADPAVEIRLTEPLANQNCKYTGEEHEADLKEEIHESERFSALENTGSLRTKKALLCLGHC